ncbi:MAG: hypothetical protein D6729_12695 [Deltaproteobacteria bacterium]|nr:MAG: hypothetical protein D6729_12695 [Deltaproteobacteria bacterium]
MARLFTWETAVVTFGGLAVVVALSLDEGAGGYTVLFGLAWLVAALPLSLLLQNALIPLYVQLGWHERALKLATLVREGAPNRKLRDVASIDVAMVQVAMGRFGDALRNLENVHLSSFKRPVRALILANRAYCRAHLGRDLDRAGEEIAQALELDPETGILAYVDGLVRYKQGDPSGARERIELSLQQEPDPSLPVPGERPWILFQVLEALGDPAAAEWLERARREGGRGPFARAIAEARATA